MPQNEYQSKYTDKRISAGQHLAELICERIADKNKQGLPYKFWSLSNWKPIFMNQLRAANSLLKLYQPEVIGNVLRKHPKVYSLRAPWLDGDFQTEQARLDSLLTIKATPQEIVLTSEVARPTFSTIKNKLKGL